MPINRHKEHLLILAEDNIYNNFTRGFVSHFAINRRKIQIDESAGGWAKLRDIFLGEYLSTLEKYLYCHVLLLLDLDKSNTRYSDLRDLIPDAIKNRVFILSCKDEAESLKSELGGGKPEKFGELLSKSCYNETYNQSDDPWCCTQLVHNNNNGELTRLAATVRPFLFNFQ